MKDLIKAIEAVCFQPYRENDAYDKAVYFRDVQDLINEHLKDKVIVPVEPTDKMIIAAKVAQRDWATSTDTTALHKVIYTAMLSTVEKGEEG